MSAEYWLDFIKENKGVKCDWCEKIVPSVELYWVESHWSIPRRLTAFCKECEEIYINKKK